MKKVTVYTIAKEAGVSVSTVSNILNHKTGNYSSETERTVKVIASKLGYQFKTKKIKLITPVLENFNPDENRFHVEMRNGIREVCKQYKFHLQELYIPFNYFAGQINEILEKDDCDGILLVGSILKKEQIDLMHISKKPYVLIDNGLSGQEHNSVSINNESTAFALTELLINNHHTNIGFVGANSDIQNYLERENGFRQAMNYYQLERKRIYDIPATQAGEIDEKKLETHLQKLIKTKNPPTAYCAANDYCAYILIKTCDRLGIKMSVTGFDNISLLEPYDDYLTTATIHSDQLGIVAIERLLQLIDNSTQTSTKILVSTEILLKNSVLKNY